MCVIIANKTDKLIDVKYLKEGAKSNPDGMGMALLKMVECGCVSH